MTITKKTFIGLMVLFCCFSLVRGAEAYVIASSDMALFNLEFSSPDKNAQLLWTDEWYGAVSAFAQDTASGSSSDYKDWLGNDKPLIAQADTAYVHSTATYSVTNGENVAIEPDGSIPDGSILATTHSELEIPNDVTTQGDGEARSNFDNFFSITKKNSDIAGDTVDVTFTLDYDGQLTGEANERGYFDIALAGLFELHDLNGNCLDDDMIFDVYFGTNTSFPEDYTGTLIVSATLNYDEEYWLYSEADSEVYGTNVVPEPGTFLLVFAGIGLAACRRLLGRNGK